MKNLPHRAIRFFFGNPLSLFLLPHHHQQKEYIDSTKFLNPSFGSPVTLACGYRKHVAFAKKGFV